MFNADEDHECSLTEYKKVGTVNVYFFKASTAQNRIFDFSFQSNDASLMRITWLNVYAQSSNFVHQLPQMNKNH